MTSQSSGGTPGLAAVLWDMDGTLIDSEPAWLGAEMDLADAVGGTWTEEMGLALVGSDLMASAGYIQEHMPCPLPAEEIVERLLDGVVDHVVRDVPWRPGARELLAALREAGVPCALVTSSYQRLTDAVIAALEPGTFDFVVTGDQVARGKPHPEPYLLAAEKLGVDPDRCVAIEDSEPGTRSAEAAGCAVLVVPAHAHPERRPDRTFWESLSGVTVADLAGLVTAHTQRSA